MAGEKHSNEIKETMVRLYNGGKGRKVKNLAIEYGIAESTVRYWVVDKPKKENKKKIKESSNSEIEEMKKEIARLKEENDILKKELIHHKVYEDFEEAMTDIIEYIENWYNNRRIQKKLGWKSPREYLKAA